MAPLFNIRSGEGRLVGLLLLHSFFIGAFRVFSGTSVYTLFLSEFGAQALPYVYLGVAVVTPLVGFVYSKLESRLSFTQLLVANLSFLLVGLGALRLGLVPGGSRWLVAALVVFADMSWVLTGLEFWGLAGRLLDVRQGKRLFGLIGSGETTASILAGFSVPALVGWLGTPNLLWLALAGLAGALGLLLPISRLYAARLASPAEAEEGESSAPAAPFSELLKNKYALWLFAFTSLALLIFYFIDNAFYSLAELHYPSEAELAAFLGVFSGLMGMVTLTASLFVSGRVFARFGLMGALLALVLLDAVGVGAVAVTGTLLGAAGIVFWFMVFTKLADEGLAPALYRPSLQILYQPLPLSHRLRFQTVVETMVEPAASAAAGIVLIALNAGAIQITYVVIVILLVWLGVTVRLGRSYPAMLRRALQRRGLSGAGTAVADRSSLEVLRQGLISPHAGVVFYALDRLEELEPASLPETMAWLLADSPPEVTLELLRRVERLELETAVPAVRELYHRASSNEIRGACLRALAVLGDAQTSEEVYAGLANPDPAIRRGCIVGLLRGGEIEGVLAAGEKLLELVNSADESEREAAAELLGEAGVRSFYRPLLKLLRDESLEVRHAALHAAGQLKNPKLWPEVLAGLTLPALRGHAVTALTGGGQAALPAVREAFANGAAWPPEALARLARACGRIGGATAVEVLLGQFEHPDEAVNTQVLLALARCRYRAEGEAAGRVQGRLRVEAERAARLLAAAADLAEPTAGGGRTPNLDLVAMALHQSLAQVRARLFPLLSFIYDPALIFQVRDNLALARTAGDRQANALEVLEGALAAGDKPLLLPLLEELSPDERLARLIGPFPQQRLSRRERLQEIAAGGNEWHNSWVQACAVYALAQAGAPEGERPALLSTIEKVIILRGVGLFAETPDDVLADMAGILEEVVAPAGKTVVEKGSLGRSMYLIVAGQVRVHDEGRELARLGENEVFGEMSILDPAPRSASVTALEETRLLRLDQEPFFELIEDHSDVARRIMQLLVRRLRRMEMRNEASG